jgi:hypothetical protein
VADKYRRWSYEKMAGNYFYFSCKLARCNSSTVVADVFDAIEPIVKLWHAGVYLSGTSTKRIWSRIPDFAGLLDPPGTAEPFSNEIMCGEHLTQIVPALILPNADVVRNLFAAVERETTVTTSTSAPEIESRKIQLFVLVALGQIDCGNETEHTERLAARARSGREGMFDATMHFMVSTWQDKADLESLQFSISVCSRTDVLDVRATAADIRFKSPELLGRLIGVTLLRYSPTDIELDLECPDLSFLVKIGRQLKDSASSCADLGN